MRDIKSENDVDAIRLDLGMAVGALRPRSIWDRLLTVFAQVSIATPVFRPPT